MRHKHQRVLLDRVRRSMGAELRKHGRDSKGLSAAAGRTSRISAGREYVLRDCSRIALCPVTKYGME